ncbi:MAG: AAA family ATPase [Aminipila sp.]
MKNKVIRIAFYGKGGIGKSTVASNIAASLSNKGLKVLYIGCDPKSDSTRNLIGFKIPTVLEIMSKQQEINKSDILFKGFKDVYCIEAGGPTPGTGCAGMGISIMAEEVERIGILDEDWDAIIYDVLGDVVCGGFSIPIRKHFVDKVYVVSSTELMSLYAANNIMKGLNELYLEKPILYGIIHNKCSGSSSIEQIKEFGKKTNTNIIYSIKVRKEIRMAECQRMTTIEGYPLGEACRDFSNLAEKILESNSTTVPTPLTDKEIDELGLQIMQEELHQLMQEEDI